MAGMEINPEGTQNWKRHPAAPRQARLVAIGYDAKKGGPSMCCIYQTVCRVGGMVLKTT